MINKENRKEAPLIWTEEELIETTKVYLDMCKLQSKGKKVNKSEAYNQLSELFGRRSQIYPLRMQNITSLFKTIDGAPILEGTTGRSTPGGKTREIILTEYFTYNKQEVPQELIETFPKWIAENKAKLKAEEKAQGSVEKEAAKAQKALERAEARIEAMKSKAEAAQTLLQSKIKAIEEGKLEEWEAEQAKIKAEAEAAKQAEAEAKAKAKAEADQPTEEEIIEAASIEADKKS